MSAILILVTAGFGRPAELYSILVNMDFGLSCQRLWIIMAPCKGTAPRDFRLKQFFMNQFSQAPKYTIIGPFRIFSKIRGDIRSSRCTTSTSLLHPFTNKIVHSYKECNNLYSCVIDINGFGDPEDSSPLLYEYRRVFGSTALQHQAHKESWVLFVC